MLFNLKNEFDRQRFIAKAQEFLGKGESVELKKRSRSHTLSQMAYLHVLLRYYASEFGYTEDEVKFEVYKRKANRDIFLAERKNRRGEMVEYYRSTASLDSEELSRSITRFRNYSSAVAGLYLPAPYEEEALFAAEQQIEQYREYI